MCDSNPSWLQEYQQPFTKQYNVQCHSGHIHQNNMPAVGFVLVRLNESSELELLLDLRSSTIEHPDTWGFIGGNLNCINEEPLDGAYREAKEEYGISANDLNILGLQYKRDHGGVKYLTYTYIFAGYNGQAPAPLTNESVQSQWFALNALPNNLLLYIKEDLQVIRETLCNEIYSMLLEAQGKCSPNPASSNQAQACQAQIKVPSSSGSSSGVDADGDVSMSDSSSSSSSSKAAERKVPRGPSVNSGFSEASAPVHSLGFCEPIGAPSYYINMAKLAKANNNVIDNTNNDQNRTLLNDQVSYPDLNAALQKLSIGKSGDLGKLEDIDKFEDIGKFEGINSLTPEQRAKLAAQATAMKNKTGEASVTKPVESKNAAKKPEQAASSIFSRFSQFLTYLGPKSTPAAAASAAATATPAAPTATQAAAAPAAAPAQQNQTNKGKQPASNDSMFSLFRWGAKRPTKVDASVPRNESSNPNGKRVRFTDASQQAGQDDESGNNKRVKIEQQTQEMPQPNLLLNTPLPATHPDIPAVTVSVPPPVPQPIDMPAAPCMSQQLNITSQPVMPVATAPACQSIPAAPACQSIPAAPACQSMPAAPAAPCLSQQSNMAPLVSQPVPACQSMPASPAAPCISQQSNTATPACQPAMPVATAPACQSIPAAPAAPCMSQRSMAPPACQPVMPVATAPACQSMPNTVPGPTKNSGRRYRIARAPRRLNDHRGPVYASQPHPNALWFA